MRGLAPHMLTIIIIIIMMRNVGRDFLGHENCVAGDDIELLTALPERLASKTWQTCLSCPCSMVLEMIPNSLHEGVGHELVTLSINMSANTLYLTHTHAHTHTHTHTHMHTHTHTHTRVCV